MEEKSKLALCLLFLTVLVSGCINGGQTTSEGSESISITEFNVNPSQVYEGSSTRVTLEAVNVGNTPAEIDIGEQGTNIMKDYCQDNFDIDEDGFSTTLSRTVDELSDENSYRLEENERIRLIWTLEQTGHVPLYGLPCDLRFEMPFDYSVQAFRQIEIKEHRDVEGSSGLESRSSKGPMTLEIGTVPGALGETSVYSAEDDSTITVHMQLSNDDPEDGYRKGVVDIDEESFNIGLDSLEFEEDCEFPEDLTLYEGRSSTITCQIKVPDKEDIPGPAMTGEINAEVDYTFVRDVGTQRVEVERRE